MKVVMFPGQGSQYRGMGKNLFKNYRAEVDSASTILGYDIEELCVSDPARKLGKTEFTQPALYVVNALTYYDQIKANNPSYLIGHSLGEFNALLAAGAYDFETGLRLVQQRGILMGAASSGGMAAVLGLNENILRRKLDSEGFSDIDIANYNTPTQLVVSGKNESITRIVQKFDEAGIKIIPLFVSAPFHSRYMQDASESFAEFINAFTFHPLRIPVISNVTASEYNNDEIKSYLSRQIISSVKWTDSIRFLLNKGITEFHEMGGTILSKMVAEIKNAVELTELKQQPLISVEKKSLINTPEKASVFEYTTVSKAELATRLGSKGFRTDYGIKYAYLAGAMYKGIASKEMVISFAKAGMLGFLGTGGMSLVEIEKNIQYIQSVLTSDHVYGMNLLHHINDMDFEFKTVQLYLKYGIKVVEAAAYMQMTFPLVYYRVKGLKKGVDRNIICDHKIVAKISRPEVAQLFMSPPPEKIVNQLLEEGLISLEQSILAKSIPMSHDVCVEADSGGHTDGAVALVLLPAIQMLKASLEKEHVSVKSIRIGLAGGLGTPQAIACAFLMGADFVLTGSVNQCTVEAGTSDVVKNLLQEINIQDTDYAPAGDMFEIGAKVQVLKKGVLFPARANKLYTLYNQYNSLEEIPAKVIEQLEKNYFKKTLQSVWEETVLYKRSRGDEFEIKKAEENPKYKMAMVFKWYFGNSSRAAMEGSVIDKVNFQIHTGPALGAFNQFVKGTDLEKWQNRHVDKIGVMLMEQAASQLEEKLLFITNSK